jgi:hypothetical protein
VNELLRRVRRRLRWAWAAVVGQLAAPIVAGVAVVLLILGRVTPLPRTGWAAVVLIGASLLALLVATIRLRIPELVTARAADRGLATRDAFATALQFRNSEAPLAARVRDRAEELAQAGTPTTAIRMPLRARRLLVTGVLGVAILVLAALPNPQDSARARARAEHAQSAAAGRKLQQAAAALAKSPNQTAQQAAVAAQLAALARQLQQGSSVNGARQAVDQLASSLASQLSPNALSEKAAVLGLGQSLAGHPLTSTTAGSASQQLSQAAAQLSQLNAAAQAALADRLGSLAATQTQGDPAAASDLSAAATALANGSSAAAAAALNAAAADQNAAATDVVNQSTITDALGALAVAGSGLAASQGSQGGQGSQGTSPGSQGSQGQGQGQGQGGQGQGQGQGQGTQGQGVGGASGQVGGTNAATAGNGATGGTGTPNGTGHNASVGLQQASVYSPVTSGAGPVLNAAGPQNSGPSQVSGSSTGPNIVTNPVQPLSNVLPQYQAQATQALATLNLPPSQRSLVESYFQGLDDAGN